MKMMGLTNFSFYMSWIITYVIVYTIISIIATILLSNYHYNFTYHFRFLCLQKHECWDFVPQLLALLYGFNCSIIVHQVFYLLNYYIFQCLLHESLIWTYSCYSLVLGYVFGNQFSLHRQSSSQSFTMGGIHFQSCSLVLLI